jgi:hypothetical protein
MTRGAWIALLAVSSAYGDKLTPQDRIEITRGMTAEFATAKAPIPRSKRPLEYLSTGSWDKAKWDSLMKELGPAARVGDLIQVTKVTIEDDRLVLEINGGGGSGKKWYQRVEVGMGTSTTPVSQSGTNAPGGTVIALKFEGKTPALKAAEIKKMLAPILDFDRRSATESYVENLPEPVKAAIKEKRAVEGMDRDQVILALGKPENKVRESKDGMDYEDWIYGKPPGKITFVTFNENKVIKVKETYAGLGGSVAPPLPPR